VDEGLRPLPVGATGATTLLTNLANRVQPIVRYDIGDRVRCLPGPCPCGSSLPVIEVHGRADDVLELPAADGQPVLLAPLALTTVLEDQAGLFDFCLEQQGRDLRLQVFGQDAATAVGARAARVLQRFLREQGVAPVRLQVRCLAERVPRGRSGKQLRVHRSA
jgi:phenylacetate-coenzyme A ligase PaaK-like adenylate-forming protein